jgi:nucleotide-binding universal stress UspA family protein
MQTTEKEMKTIPAEAPAGDAVPSLRQQEPTAVAPHLNTVVIAVADSKHSEYAFNWALEHFVTGGPNEKVVLLSIQPIRVVGGYYGMGEELYFDTQYFEEMERKEFSAICAVLRQHRKKLITKFRDAKVEMVVGHGDAGEDIVDYVDKIKADALIIGSRGLGTMKRYLLLI